MMYFKAIPFRR